MTKVQEPLLEDGVIHGRRAARVVRAEVKASVARLRERGVQPCVAFVRVGDDAASEVYVNAKTRACGWVGIESRHIHLPASTTEAELVNLVRHINENDEIDAVLVQLPLPEKIPSQQVLNLIDPFKDVDAFHHRNLGALLAGYGPVEPCTPAGVMRLMRMLGVDPRGKHAVVLGRSVIVGRPMYNLLVRADATVTVCHRYTKDTAALVRQADIVVTATGVAGLVRGEWIKPGAYVFDVGTTRGEDGKLWGDVRFDEVLGRAAGVTPVPGGVGPMTIACLLENTIKCAHMRRGWDNGEIRRA